MSALSSLAVQQAVASTLTGDATLMGLVHGVYDAVPQSTAYPYVVMDEQQLRGWNTSTTVGAELTLVLHVFSREAGRMQALTIAQRLYALLHESALVVSGQSFTHVRCVGQEVTLLEDAVTFHAAQTYRITTHT